MTTFPRQALDIDFDSLFPGEPVSIGSTQVFIRPLGLEQLIIITKKIKGIGKIFTEEGINWENYNSKDNLFKISILLLENFPDVLEEASNIELVSLKKLPLDIVVQIVNKVIEVNMKSKDDLSKNFKSLVEKFAPIQAPEQTPEQNKKIAKIKK